MTNIKCTLRNFHIQNCAVNGFEAGKHALNPLSVPLSNIFKESHDMVATMYAQESSLPQIKILRSSTYIYVSHLLAQYTKMGLDYSSTHYFWSFQIGKSEIVQ